jgi:hypothetical protein
MQKQIKGEEVGVGIYRFFGSELLDLNVGGKSQEPLQLGVRTTIEQSVLELVGAITGVDANVCIDPIMEPRRVAPKGQLPVVAGPAQPLAVQGKANGKANGNGNLTALIDPSSTQSGGLVPQNRSLVAQGAGYELQFVTATADISPQTRSQIEKMAAEASQGKVVNYKLLSRDTENFPPLQRRELTSERISAVSNILSSLGVSALRIKVLWRPDPTDAGIRREGGGTQLIASLAIEP